MYREQPYIPLPYSGMHQGPMGGMSSQYQHGAESGQGTHGGYPSGGAGQMDPRLRQLEQRLDAHERRIRNIERRLGIQG